MENRPDGVQTGGKLMGSKPKRSDYQPSAADKQNAAISLQRYNDFRAKYAPLLTEARDKAMANGTVKLARGRANADTMQTLQANTPSARAATTVDETTGMTGRALASQLEKATAQGLSAANDQAAGVLASANQQALTAQDGLAAVARINTTDTLKRAARKQSERDAMLQAGVQLGTSFLSSGIRNVGGGGTFMSPNISDTVDAAGNVINPTPAKTLAERFKVGMGRI